MWQLWHWKTSYCRHLIHGSLEKCLGFPPPQHLEQIPTVPSNPNEPALVGMWNFVDAESLVQQAWGLSSPKYPANTPHFNVPSEGKNTCIMSMCGGCFTTFLVLAIWLPLISLIFLGKQCADRTIVQPSKWWLCAATMFVVSAVPSFTTRISLWKSSSPFCECPWSHHQQMWLPT